MQQTYQDIRNCWKDKRRVRTDEIKRQSDNQERRLSSLLT